MQKHERIALEAAQIEARKLSGNLTVSFSTHRGTKAHGKLTMRGPGGERFRSVPCSPGRQDDLPAHIRQWVRREGRKII